MTHYRENLSACRDNGRCQQESSLAHLHSAQPHVGEKVKKTLWNLKTGKRALRRVLGLEPSYQHQLVPLVKQQLSSPVPLPEAMLQGRSWPWHVRSFPRALHKALPNLWRDKTWTGYPRWYLLSSICFQSTRCFSHFSLCGLVETGFRETPRTFPECSHTFQVPPLSNSCHP